MQLHYHLYDPACIWSDSQAIHFDRFRHWPPDSWPVSLLWPTRRQVITVKYQISLQTKCTTNLSIPRAKANVWKVCVSVITTMNKIKSYSYDSSAVPISLYVLQLHHARYTFRCIGFCVQVQCITEILRRRATLWEQKVKGCAKHLLVPTGTAQTYNAHSSWQKLLLLLSPINATAVVSLCWRDSIKLI